MRYRIDGGDRIASVDDTWVPFALANGGKELTRAPVGRAIWDFVSGVTTRAVYRELFARVRSGRTVTFPYRCDSPTLRRFLRMQLSPVAEDGIQFDSATLTTEARQPVELATVAGGAGLVTICSWCKRVAVGDEWVEIEIAVERLGLFGTLLPGGLTHGACQECITLVLRDADTLAPTRISP